MKLKFTHTLFAIISVVAFSNIGFGQGVFFDPSPTDVTLPARLYIDITSPECACPELQNVNLDNPLYIWTWHPVEERQNVDGKNIKNGAWDNSNDNLKMTQDAVNPKLWYFDFVGASLTEFYQAPAAEFYDSGIWFLVKTKDGYPANDGQPERKSPDINIIPEPIGCFEKVCPFPTKFFQDEYFVITYDNTQETIPTLQNMGADECMIWYKYSVNGGSLKTYRESTDKFKMAYDGDGVFSITMIPQEYFTLSEGEELTRIDVFITKAPINQPPFTSAISLFPGCD